MGYKKNKKIFITLFAIFIMLTITCITIFTSSTQILQIAISEKKELKADKVSSILLTGKVNLEAANGKGRSRFRLVNI